MSRYGVARSLSDWPSAVLSLLPPFAAPPLRGGWCPGWGVAPPEGRGLDATEPSRSTLRTIQGGRKEAEGQPQAEPPHTPLREDSPASGGSSGWLGRAAPLPGAGRGSEAAPADRSAS